MPYQSRLLARFLAEEILPLARDFDGGEVTLTAGNACRIVFERQPRDAFYYWLDGYLTGRQAGKVAPKNEPTVVLF